MIFLSMFTKANDRYDVTITITIREKNNLCTISTSISFLLNHEPYKYLIFITRFMLFMSLLGRKENAKGRPRHADHTTKLILINTHGN